MFNRYSLGFAPIAMFLCINSVQAVEINCGDHWERYHIQMDVEPGVSEVVFGGDSQVNRDTSKQSYKLVDTILSEKDVQRTLHIDFAEAAGGYLEIDGIAAKGSYPVVWEGLVSSGNGHAPSVVRCITKK